MQWIKNNHKSNKRDWHLWFAWKPVTVCKYPDGNEKKVWLETVIRKYSVNEKAIRVGVGIVWDIEYKEIPAKEVKIVSVPDKPSPSIIDDTYTWKDELHIPIDEHEPAVIIEDEPIDEPIDEITRNWKIKYG